MNDEQKMNQKALAAGDQMRQQILEQIKSKYQEGPDQLRMLLELARTEAILDVDKSPTIPLLAPVVYYLGFRQKLMALGALVLQEAMVQWHQDGEVPKPEDMELLMGSAEDIIRKLREGCDDE